jgi:hypothetical protein
MITRPSQPPAALRGRWLLLARAAWVVLTVKSSLGYTLEAYPTSTRARPEA